MSQHSLVDRLRSAGAEVRCGKLGSILLVNFTQKSDSDSSPVVAGAEEGLPWLADLGECIKCRELYLTGQPVGDSAVEFLVGRMPTLQVLDLDQTHVTESVLGQVESLEKLKILSLSGTSVSDDRIREARKRLIQTRIIKLH
jgi:hypothetical protein